MNDSRTLGELNVDALTATHQFSIISASASCSILPFAHCSTFYCTKLNRNGKHDACGFSLPRLWYTTHRHTPRKRRSMNKYTQRAGVWQRARRCSSGAFIATGAVGKFSAGGDPLSAFSGLRRAWIALPASAAGNTSTAGWIFAGAGLCGIVSTICWKTSALTSH